MTNSRFVTNYVASMQAFISAWDQLRAADRVYQDEGLGASLKDADMPPNLTAAQFVAAVGSWETVDGLIQSGNHFTNFYRLLP